MYRAYRPVLGGPEVCLAGPNKALALVTDGARALGVGIESLGGE